jgi:hypothetical protein
MLGSATFTAEASSAIMKKPSSAANSVSPGEPLCFGTESLAPRVVWSASRTASCRLPFWRR